MKKRVFKIILIAMMLIFVYATVVSALSFTATMTPSSTAVPESTEFTIEVKISNLDVGTNGVNSLSGYLKYDEEVFEPINDSSIDGLNSWKPDYGTDTGKITLTKQTFVKTEEKVFQIAFKTKSGVTGKSGEIKFTNIVASNSETTIAAADISTSITVGNAGEGNTANVTNTPSNGSIIALPVANNTANNTSNTNTNTNTNSNIVSPYTNNTNTAGDDIPYTGVEDTIMYLGGAILVLAIVFYIKFEIVNKEIK